MTSLPNLRHLDVVAIDGETTGLKWWQDELFGVGIAWHGERGIQGLYLDLRVGNNKKWLRQLISQTGLVVNHHVKFDAHFLREAEVPLRVGHVDCTMIREALLDEGRHSFALEAICQDHFGEGKDESIWQKLADLFGGKPIKKDQIGNMWKAPEEIVAPYARQDAILALRLWDHQRPRLEADQLLGVAAVERQLLDVVIRMEHGGVRVDVEQAERARASISRQIAKGQRQLNRLAGFEVNVNSSPQVIKIVRPVKSKDGVWRSKDGVMLEDTDGGGPSIKTHALNNMNFEEAQLIALLRSWHKARDTFIEEYILGMNHNGYLHASINQTRTEFGTGTYTGRFSITDPALQQIHKRDKVMAAVIRSLFIPDPGCLWGAYDWEQMDFRMFAHYTKSAPVLAAYQRDRNADFHGTVSELTGLPRNRDAKTGGANAKQINLGMVFGMGQGRMASEMGLPYYKDERGFLRAGDAALEVFNKYHHAIPGVRAFLNQVESVAKARGWITTPLGRRIRFPNPKLAYKAGGLLFQAAAADALKIKMVELDQLLQDDDTGDRLALVVHDEFDVVHRGTGAAARQKSIQALLERFDGERTPITFRVPIVCKSKVARNWWEASK